MRTLREYQTADVRAIHAALNADQRALYVAPTGSGKTVVAARVIQMRQGDPTLILVHRKELLEQMIAALVADDIDPESISFMQASRRWVHGRVARRRYRIRAGSDAPIVVASIDTIDNREVITIDPKLVVVDEAHHVAAATYGRVLSRFRGARMLGMTAVPMRADRKPMRPYWDEMIVGKSADELIALGHLKRPRVFTVPDEMLPQLSEVRITAGDYNRADAAGVMRRSVLIGHLPDEYKRVANGERAVVFVLTVAHAEEVCAAFVAKGVPAEVLVGETSDGTPTKAKERAAILDRLRRGRTRVVVNCDILTEGWDMPDVACVMIARPTLSLALYLQMCGRAMRHEAPVILDHVGAALAFGPPHRDRAWSLDAPARGTRGSGPLGKRCPSCPEVVAISQAVCECGHVFFERGSPEERSAQLVEMPAEWTGGCVDCGKAVSRSWRTRKVIKSGRSPRCFSCAHAARRSRNFACTECGGAVTRGASRCLTCHLNARAPTPRLCIECRSALQSLRSWRCGPCAAKARRKPSRKCSDCGVATKRSSIRCVPCSVRAKVGVRRVAPKTCLDCTAEISRESTRCSSCSVRAAWKTRQRRETKAAIGDS